MHCRTASFLGYTDTTGRAGLIIRASENGFTYTGVGNRVQCTSCRVTVAIEDALLGAHERTCLLLAELAPRARELRQQQNNRLLYTQHARLKTFFDWPNRHPLATELAENGFIYTGTDDRVKCAWCNGVLHSWEPTDNVADQHRQHFPRCPLVLMTSTPVNPLNPLNPPQPPQPSQDVVKAASVEPQSSQDVVGFASINLVSIPSSTLQPPPQPQPQPQPPPTEVPSLGSIEEETEKLKSERLCKVCMDRDVNTVFLPCGHLVTCADCAKPLPKCPICRTFIRGTVRVFVS